MSRVLCFQQITDSRFDTDILELLNSRVEKLKNLLDIEGIVVRVGEPRLIDWGDSIQYRTDFAINKTTRALTWNDIYKLVNSVKAVPYKFV